MMNSEIVGFQNCLGFKTSKEVDVMSLTYNELVRVFEGNICDISFTKLDGTKRDMTCTLNQIDESVGEIADGHNNSSKENITVWDLENKGWRSFCKDTLLKCTVVTSIVEL